MKKIFVCSPLRGNIKGNIERAKVSCRIIALMGLLPIAPHVYFTQFLDDAIEQEREMGMSMGFEMLKGCDALWHFQQLGTPVSSGMRAEIDMAVALDIPVFNGWERIGSVQ